MSRRHIRLTEWGTNVQRQVQPTEKYLASTDGTLSPGAVGQTVDARGFVLAGVEDLERPAEVEIHFLGDSFVECHFMPEATRFPAAAQKLLQSRALDVKCLNAARSSANLLHMLFVLLAKVGRSPSVVVLVPTMKNDCYTLLRAGGYWNPSDDTYAPILPVTAPAPGAAVPLDRAPFDALLRSFVFTAQELGHPLLLGTFPYRTAARDAAAPPNAFPCRHPFHVHYADMNRVVRDVGARFAVPVVDLESEFLGRPEFFYDDMHFNEQGSLRAGELVADALEPLVRRAIVPAS